MADHERGAYTPPTPDSPIAFEARQPVRGARPFPLTLVVSVVVLLGLAAAIFVFYRAGVRQGSAAPQAVGVPVGGLKSPPPADGQPQDSSQGLEIYRSESGQPPQLVPAQPTFAPAPEQPQARPQGGPPVVVTPPPAAASAPAAAATPAPLPTASQLRPAQPAPSPPAATPKAAAVPPPAEVAAAAPPRAKPAAAKPKAAATTPTPAKAAAAKPEKPASAAKGAAAVQIGAVASEALADKTWNEAVAVSPGLATGKGKGVEAVQKDGKTLYRTSVTGFASRADAQAFCDKLKSAGKACFVK
jgi:hypothetical protein